MGNNKYRGYITSSMRERSVPQNIQQLVIREYCKKNGMDFLLSATEYHEGTMMLQSILYDDNDNRGIVFYSIFQLPEDAESRREILTYMKPLHFAAENITIRTTKDVDKLEDIFLLRSIACKR